MGANGGDERLGEALGKLPAIVTSRSASRTQKVIMLRRVADEIAATVAPHAVCTKGCSRCCHQHIMISELEARLIESATGRKRASPSRTPGQDLVRVTDEKQHRYLGVPCTFLGDDGACTIYEHRPIKCRTHFTLADDPALCDTARGLNVRDLPLFESSAFEQAKAAVIYDTTFADIREFFPEPSSGGTSGRPDERHPDCLAHNYGCAQAHGEAGPCVKGTQCRELARQVVEDEDDQRRAAAIEEASRK
jgi:Fe-S-cluster containining protein